MPKFSYKQMIQRIQTVYLSLAGILSGGLVFVLNLWKDMDGNEIYALDLLKTDGILSLKVIPFLFVVSTLLAFYSVLSFKKRQFQFVLGRLNMLINLFLLGLLVYHLRSLSGETLVSEKGIGAFIPIVVIVLLVMANKAIKRDEDLVKSVDRIR